MKPWKKQRVDSQDVLKDTVGLERKAKAKEKKNDPIPEESDNSAEDENLDEIIEKKDEDGEFDGRISFSYF